MNPTQPTEQQQREAGCLDRYGYSEAHEEHMRINGECPWCGAWK